jgi:hypothetical protein
MACDANFLSTHPMLVIKQLELEEDESKKVEVVLEGGVLVHRNTQCT